jgi:DNA-binding response OmpR family regulator
MPTILLLAENSEADRLKPVFESLGHEVVHLSARLSSPSPLDLSEEEGRQIDLVAIDTDDQLQHLEPVIQHLRDQPATKEAPILLLMDEEVLPGLDFGLNAEDIAVKPLRQGELRARIRRLLWQADRPDDDQMIKVKDLLINKARYEVRVKGVTVDMTLKEYELLQHLVTHADRVFTRADLLDSIWGYDYYGGMRTVDVHIRRLRSKLGEMGEAINTVRGVGYSFSTP